jgi:hypothetical protein
MGLTLRNIKGSPLTYTEMDDNLLYLESLTGSIASASYALTASYALNGGGGGSTPGGSNTQIQFNSGSVLSGSSKFTYNYLTSAFYVDGTTLSTGGFTGSLQGTSSWAEKATTASWAGNATTASLALNSQALNGLDSSSFAITGSNIFKASQVISGSVTITNDLVVLGSSSIQYITSSQLDIADNIISVNAFNPSIRFGGLSVIDSGSSPRVSGSILFDSTNNNWVTVHQGTNTTSSIVITGPETYNGLGNETRLTQYRLAKATSTSGDHIGDSNVSDNGSTVSINSYTEITGSTTISGSLNQGFNSTASGVFSFARGYYTTASGNYSHAEGGDPIFEKNGGIAYGNGSHAEGGETVSSGSMSHAEGILSISIGYGSHAEGANTRAYGLNSHAEGRLTIASGSYSHTEGSYVLALGDSSHAEGFRTTASADYSHAEGNRTKALNIYAHAEGSSTIASGSASHAEGNTTIAYGQSSHAEGFGTTANADYSHAEGGVFTFDLGGGITYGEGSHAEGIQTVASGSGAHAEGRNTEAKGISSHAEGWRSLSKGNYSHAEGGDGVEYDGGIAHGVGSHAEGSATIASGSVSHAEGYACVAIGYASHAEGFGTTAYAGYSHANGLGTIASGSYQNVVGQYNKHNNTTSLFTIGNGASDVSRNDIVNVTTTTVQVTGSLSITGSAYINNEPVASSLLLTNRQTADYTLDLSDANKLVESEGDDIGTTINITIPPYSSVNFPTGTQISLAQYGLGITNVAAGIGVTIRSSGGKLKLAGRYSGASLVKIATNEWYLFGDLIS